MKTRIKKVASALHKDIKAKHISLKRKILVFFVLLFLVGGGFLALWLSTIKMPDLSSLESRKVVESTKIYDRTGKILLYDVHQNAVRTTIPFEDISINVKNATIAIEDAEFYTHGGIKFTSIILSILANILSGSYKQGGSTITQQVVKNSLLTNEKTISRKLKEWVLSIELDNSRTKEEILAMYLNEIPYGGTIYGVEEASEAFFNKKASAVTLAEAAYLAAIPKAPTFYSPYGQNRDKLDTRKNLVLQKMLENNFITQDEYNSAIKEVITFSPKQTYGINAPHFVEFIKQYLAEKYGEGSMEQNGYKVITTIDYPLQVKAEEILNKYALSNEKNFNARNDALVAIDPKTGQILAMVGSRNYFDKEIDGNFNVTIAKRQPGSTFKPFVYATAFKKGYTPDTVVFDVPTEFQTTCTPEGKPRSASVSEDECYMPENYDGLYLGPISLRNALAQSRNVPAIKTLYLAGMKDSLNTAKDMGITTLSDDPFLYGLTLVLGGGEVSLLDITSAYGVFANNGTRNPYTGIISVEDSKGNIIEEYHQNSQTVIDSNIASLINDILSDKEAKLPAYGASSPLFISGYQVASKTGTTNNYRDAWTIGYTPEIVIGTWAGNNDNTPMEKKVAGMIVAPMWGEVMSFALSSTTGETFLKPAPIDETIKPVLRGLWQGNETYFIDKISGGLATDMTPSETKMEVSVPNIHSILYWIDKSSPLGDVPSHPESDSQYESWEYAVQNWLLKNPQTYYTKPSFYDNVHSSSTLPRISILSPRSDANYNKDSRIMIVPSISSKYPVGKVNYYLNDELVGTALTAPYTINFVPSSVNALSQSKNIFRAVVYDNVYNKGETSIEIKII